MNIICKAVSLLVFCSALHPALFAGNKPVLPPATALTDSVLQRETANINGIKYTAINFIEDHNGDPKFYIKDGTGKVVFTRTNQEPVVYFKFIDFNGDGCKDILVELSGVDSGHQDLILYDKKSKGFILAGSCSNAEKIKGTKYYYSYNDCCMGRFWSSDLFYISNSKIVNTGCIKYDDDGYGLSFFRYADGKRILLKKWHVRINGSTPVTTGRHIDFNLGRYWSRHWKSFSN